MWYRDLVNGDGVLEVPTDRRTFLGTPLFIYREGLAHLRGWCASLFTANADRRFFHETRMWYLVGFVWTRFSKRSRHCWMANRSCCSPHARPHSPCDSHGCEFERL